MGVPQVCFHSFHANMIDLINNDAHWNTNGPTRRKDLPKLTSILNFLIICGTCFNLILLFKYFHSLRIAFDLEKVSFSPIDLSEVSSHLERKRDSSLIRVFSFDGYEFELRGIRLQLEIFVRGR